MSTLGTGSGFPLGSPAPSLPGVLVQEALHVRLLPQWLASESDKGPLTECFGVLGVTVSFILTIRKSEISKSHPGTRKYSKFPLSESDIFEEICCELLKMIKLFHQGRDIDLHFTLTCTLSVLRKLLWSNAGRGQVGGRRSQNQDAFPCALRV